jgi:hypothetical protein
MRLWNQRGGGPENLETTALYKTGVGESFATRMEIDFFFLILESLLLCVQHISNE